MTSVGRAADGRATVTTTATFAEDGTETWTMVAKDPAGAVVEQSSGQNTPREKAAK